MAFLKHLATFPAEVLVCMLPWSVLLVAYLRRDFRRSLGSAAADVRFLACAVAVAFPTCWLVPGARNRYFAPLYPCLALLIGLVVERCCQASAAPWARLWRWYVRGFGLAMPATAIWVVAATTLGWTVALGRNRSAGLFSSRRPRRSWASQPFARSALAGRGPKSRCLAWLPLPG